MATGLAFVGLAWLAWASRRHPVLTTFLWLLFAFDLAFIALFVVEARGCSELV